MKLERDVIVDLLPAYFSGEASSATRALVEEYFREDPAFEKFARGAGGPLEMLKAPVDRPDPEKEKFALERARLVTETRSSFFGLGIITTLMLFLFRIQGGKIVWIMWEQGGVRGICFAAMAVFFWTLYFYVRRRAEPLQAHTKFLWMSIFYSLLVFLFKIRNHKLIFVFFYDDPSAGFIFAFFAASLWVIYFVQRYKARTL
jgi:hypothetical protein